MNIFTGVEKKNDDFRRYFYTKINRWDSAKDLLLVEKRQEALKDCERVKRGYVKRKESFWMEGGKQQAAKKVVRVSTSTPEFPNTTTPHQQYTLAELKKMKATELLVLLFQQGRVFNKRTRKQVSINAYLGDAINIPRDNWKNLKTKQTYFNKIIIWKKKQKPAV